VPLVVEAWPYLPEIEKIRKGPALHFINQAERAPQSSSSSRRKDQLVDSERAPMGVDGRARHGYKDIGGAKSEERLPSTVQGDEYARSTRDKRERCNRSRSLVIEKSRMIG